MENDNRKITTYPSIVKFIFFSILSVVFTLGSMFLILVGLKINLGFIDTTIKEGYSYTFVAFIGILGFVMFSPMAFYYIRRIIVKKPSLSIDNDGIYDNATYASAGYLSWSDIEAICIYKQEYKIGSQRILGIKLKNKNEFIEKFHGLKKVFIRMSIYPVNIPQNAINIDIEELYSIVGSYLNKKRS